MSDEVRRASLDYYIKQLQPGGDWSMYHNIMLSVRSIEEALYYWEHGIRNVMFCVEISSMEHFRAYDASPIPWKYIMAYIRLAVNPDLQPVYDLLHAEGVMTMTSITGSSDKVKKPLRPPCGLPARAGRRTRHHRDRLPVGIHRPAVVARCDPRPAGSCDAQPPHQPEVKPEPT